MVTIAPRRWTASLVAVLATLGSLTAPVVNAENIGPEVEESPAPTPAAEDSTPKSFFPLLADEALKRGEEVGERIGREALGHGR